MLRYTVLRILVFLGCLLAFWLAGLRSQEEMLLLVVLAAASSMIISFFALKRFREAYSAEVAERLQRRAATRAQRAAEQGVAATDEDAEDAEIARRRDGSGPGTPADSDSDFR
jgi:hypothetical protein